MVTRETCPTHGIALTPDGCLLCRRREATELPSAREPRSRGWLLALSLAGLAMGLGALVLNDAQSAMRLQSMDLRVPSVAAMEAELAAIEQESPGGTFNVVPAPRFDQAREDTSGEGEVTAQAEAEVSESSRAVVGGRVVEEEKLKPRVKVVYVQAGPVRVIQRARPVFFTGSGTTRPGPRYRPRYRRGQDGKFQPRGGAPRPSGGTPSRRVSRPRYRPTAPAPKIGAPR